jgi:hypothetical protein
MQGPVYAELSSYTRAKPPPQQNDSCSIFRTSLWKTVREVITRRLARKTPPGFSLLSIHLCRAYQSETHFCGR